MVVKRIISEKQREVLREQTKIDQVREEKIKAEMYRMAEQSLIDKGEIEAGK